MTSPELRDGAFDEPAVWTLHYQDARFEQRFRIVGEAIFAETTVRVLAAPSDIVVLLLQPWDWWEHGRVVTYRRNPDASVQMEFKPIWWYLFQVGMHMLATQELPLLGGTRVPVVYSGHFNGPGTLDVYPGSKNDGNAVIRSRFHGVRMRFPLPFVTPALGARSHLSAESGRIMIPFARGTGYVGLIRRLEQR